MYIGSFSAINSILNIWLRSLQEPGTYFGWKLSFWFTQNRIWKTFTFWRCSLYYNSLYLSDLLFGRSIKTVKVLMGQEPCLPYPWYGNEGKGSKRNGCHQISGRDLHEKATTDRKILSKPNHSKRRERGTLSALFHARTYSMEYTDHLGEGRGGNSHDVTCNGGKHEW